MTHYGDHFGFNAARLGLGRSINLGPACPAAPNGLRR
jgi:hypothetical protein